MAAGCVGVTAEFLGSGFCPGSSCGQMDAWNAALAGKPTTNKTGADVAIRAGVNFGLVRRDQYSRLRVIPGMGTG